MSQENLPHSQIEPTPELQRHNVDYVPLNEATDRYKRLGNEATKLLVSHIGLTERVNTLEQESVTDRLTGLANQKSFDLSVLRYSERANQTDAKSGEDTNFGILTIDVDNFKKVNDNYGHDEGDDVLKLVALAIRDSIRETDTPAHIGTVLEDESEESYIGLRHRGESVDLGTVSEDDPEAVREHGDEFKILVPKIRPDNPRAEMTNQERMDAMAARVKESVRQAIAGSKHNGKLFDLGVGVSVGTAIYRKGEKVEKLLKRSETSLRKDKNSRNTGR